MYYTFPISGDAWRVTSRFGPRNSPGGIGSTNHKGVDLAAAYGTPIVSPQNGYVTYAGNMGGFGKTIKILGEDGNTYLFGHLSSIDIKAGENVSRGSLLGKVGNSGNSTGNHLHLGVYKDGRAIDPANIFDEVKNKFSNTIEKFTGKKLELKGTAKKAAVAAATAIGGPIAGAAADSVMNDCDLWCRIKKWIDEELPKFFERVGFAILAFILIAAAFWLFSSGVTQRVINQTLNK